MGGRSSKATTAPASAEAAATPPANGGAAPTTGEKAPRSRRNRGQKDPATASASTSTELFVKNLPDDASAESVKALFQVHGNVTGVDVKFRVNGKCRGFAFVSFATTEEATKAMSSANGVKMGDKELSVVMATPKDKPEGEDGKGKGKGKGKGEKDGGKGAMDKGSGKGGFDQAQVQAWAAAAASNPYFQQQQMAAMYGAQYPGYGAWRYDYSNPFAYQAAAYYAAAAAAAVASTPTPQQQAAYGSQYSFGVPAGQTGGTYEGFLKSLSDKHAYGFIQCEETFRQFRRDVYVGRKELPEGVQVGSRLKFEIVLNNKEHPRAAKVSIMTGSG